jgi:hypothetical protein
MAMKKFSNLLCYLSFTILFISCTALGQQFKETGGLIQPGDKNGKMTFEQGDPLLPYPYLWQF